MIEELVTIEVMDEGDVIRKEPEARIHSLREDMRETLRLDEFPIDERILHGLRASLPLTLVRPGLPYFAEDVDFGSFVLESLLFLLPDRSDRLLPLEWFFLLDLLGFFLDLLDLDESSRDLPSGRRERGKFSKLEPLFPVCFFLYHLSGMSIARAAVFSPCVSNTRAVALGCITTSRNPASLYVLRIAII